MYFMWIDCATEQLFNAGVAVDVVDCDNNTALHHACSHVSYWLQKITIVLAVCC